MLRDFNSHLDWHPIIADSWIEGGEAPDQVGCVRAFRLKDGNELREQLLTLDDRHHISTYCILDATIPLQRYVATVKLSPVTDGDRTFWHWQSTFATPPGRERELADAVGNGVYEAGFAALREYLRAHAGGAQRGGATQQRRARGHVDRARRTGRPRTAAGAARARRPHRAPAKCACARARSASTTSMSTRAPAPMRNCSRSAACRASRPRARCSTSAPA